MQHIKETVFWTLHCAVITIQHLLSLHCFAMHGSADTVVFLCVQRKRQKIPENPENCHLQCLIQLLWIEKTLFPLLSVLFFCLLQRLLSYAHICLCLVSSQPQFFLIEAKYKGNTAHDVRIPCTDDGVTMIAFAFHLV